MNAIFISYRRGDGAAFAGRLFDYLAARFGDRRVFMDVDDIEPGRDFVEAIDRAMAECGVLLVVVGKQWLREQVGEDFVLREIRAALHNKLTIIPILIEGATMPAAAELPAELAPFTRKNAIVIRDSHFHDDVAGLLRLLKGAVPRAQAPSRSRFGGMLAAALSVLLVLGGLYWYRTVRFDPQTLAGDWRGEVTTSQGYRYVIEVHFVVFDGVLTGTVRYPTGLAVIGAARLDGRRLDFHTEHIPQFETETALIRFHGRLTENDRIEFLMESDQGQERFVAEKQAP